VSIQDDIEAVKKDIAACLHAKPCESCEVAKRLLAELEKLRDSLAYCERRSAIELVPLVMATPGNEHHYHAVLRMIRDEARRGLGIKEKT
jgi:hypothetical protein